VAKTTPRKPDRPVFWIVAGPNGSGKSSLYNSTDIDGWGGSVWIINPDLLTAKIIESEGSPPAEANLAAVQRIETWLEHSLDAYQTIGVETVLSSGKYRRLVDLAHRRKFDVRMIYVVLRSAELQLERIVGRVRDGGHDVPEEKVRSRRLRSFEQLAWFCGRVDRCYVYDNSTGEPQLLAEFADGGMLFWQTPPEDLAAVLRAAKVKITHFMPG
jgi:predicted ABC-type ATPase